MMRDCIRHISVCPLSGLAVGAVGLRMCLQAVAGGQDAGGSMRFPSSAVCPAARTVFARFSISGRRSLETPGSVGEKPACFHSWPGEAGLNRSDIQDFLHLQVYFNRCRTRGHTTIRASEAAVGLSRYLFEVGE